jgi:hypothetical protein
VVSETINTNNYRMWRSQVYIIVHSDSSTVADFGVYI